MSVTRRAVAARAESVQRRVLARLGREWWRGTEWERVRSAGLFDPEWYRSVYRDVPRGRLDPLWHYSTTGAAEGRDPNPMFDTRWYLDTYPDVAQHGINPLVHYLDHGAGEGRDPGPRFDTNFYLRTNADVRVAGVNPLGHYLSAGEREGRRPTPLSRRGVRRSVTAVVVSGEPDTPGHQYRVVRLADALTALGHTAIVRTPGEASLRYAAELEQAAVVVLWRCVWGPEVERIVQRARRAGAVVVFDVDDLMVNPDLAVSDVVDGIRSQGLTEEEAQDWFAKMRRTATASDACIASTPVLAEHLRDLGKPTWVLPNGFDDPALIRSRLAVRTRRSTDDDGLVRIGYAAGSLTHQRDFAQAAAGVAAVLRARPACRLVLYRGTLQLDEFPAFDDLRDQVEWREVVPPEDLPVELARLDVNLAPLEVGNPFCEAKSPLKLFEAALVDVPTVASPTEPFRDAITHRVDGFLAAGEARWAACLDALVVDPVLRQTVGRAAHASMRWEHGPERRRQVVAGLLDQLLDDGPAAASTFELELVRRCRTRAPAPNVSPADVVLERDSLRRSRVTVVIPVHDYAEYVVDALESVRDQTLDDLDLVVVDDASTDDSLEVARKWLTAHAARFNRVLLLSLRENAGLARARNTGFEAAETPFVLPLDADNALLPPCCERLLQRLDEGAGAFAYPRIRHVGDTSDLFSEGQVRGYLPYAPQRLVPSNYIDAMALISKTAWSAVGGYHQDLYGWEDYDLWCRFAERGLYGVQVAEDLALYRVHPGSMLHTVTHHGDRLAAVHERVCRNHPWLRLEGQPRTAPLSSTVPRPVPYVRPPAGSGPQGEQSRPAPPSGLSDRSRALLPLLRCPATHEPLVETADGALESAETRRRWPVVEGRPVLFPGMTLPPVVAAEHVGNPLPERARDLLAQTRGRVLHMSGGGTATGHANAVELDAALFGPTDLVADAHVLPFADGTFDLVLAVNAFEHYREPPSVVGEIQRVLRPGGFVFLHTAFLQPLHESPHHYYNCTRYGLEQWFRDFDTVDLTVSENFHPGFALAWLAAEAEDALATDVSAEAAAEFRGTGMGVFSDYWRDPASRAAASPWAALGSLRRSRQEQLAAGFEYLGRTRA